jgi:hypothetical protein
MKRPAVAGLFYVGLGRLPTRFLLLNQKKSGKEKVAPCHGLRLPWATRQSKRLRISTWQLTQSVSRCGFQTVLAENPWIACVARHGSRGFSIISQTALISSFWRRPESMQLLRFCNLSYSKRSLDNVSNRLRGDIFVPAIS